MTNNFTPTAILNHLILIIGSKYPDAKREIDSLNYSLLFTSPEAINNKFWGWDGPSKGFPGLCQYHFSNKGDITICIKKFYDACVKKFKEDEWKGEFNYGKFI